MSIDNDTSICPASTTEYSAELLEAVNVYLLIVQGIIVSIIAIAGAILTVSLMMIIVMNKELHKRTFIISLQLMVLDVVFIVFVNGSIVVTSMAREWVFGQVWCIVSGIVSQLAVLWRGSILFVLTLDRFLTVFYPFSYKKKARKVVVATSIILFVISLAIVTSPIFGVGCYEFSESALFCIITSLCNAIEYLCYVRTTILSAQLIIVGALLPLGMYIAMFIKAKRIQGSAPQMGEHEGEENAIYNNQEHASNQRAKVTVAILFVCLICLSFPFYIRILLAILFDLYSSGYYIAFLLNDIFFLFPITDTIIIWKNKDIKDTVKKLYKKLQQVISF